MNISSASSNISYSEAYPSLKEPRPAIFVVTGIYLVCFVVGICGNASTLTLMGDFGTPRAIRKHTNAVWRQTHNRFRVYVATLCIVDSLMLLSLPSAIVDSLMGFWIFGTALCKFHHFCGSVGRMASTLVITTMSIDRYLAVVSPHRFDSRSNRTTRLIMLMLFSVASILLLPLIIFAKAEKLFLFESRSRPGHIVQIRIFKCMDSMPVNMLFWFTGSTFVVAYFLPMIVIMLVNSRLLLKIRKHRQKLSAKSSIPMRRVTAYIMIIAAFYLISWTPYWMGVLYVSYVDLFESRTIKNLTNGSEETMFLVYCAHICPYLNAATNWLITGRLARNMSGELSTSNRTELPSKNGDHSLVFVTNRIIRQNEQQNEDQSCPLRSSQFDDFEMF